MALIAWDPSYSVGLAQFDQQHKRLIDILNRLHDAMMDGRGVKVLDGLILELVDYTVYHFLAEEKLFLETGYPDFAAHKREHDAFTVRIKAARGKASSALTLATMNQLTDWLRNHILGTDQRYWPYVGGRKVA